jgi:tetratricopeptide (TPR) repeat protein
MTSMFTASRSLLLVLIGEWSQASTHMEEALSNSPQQGHSTPDGILRAAYGMLHLAKGNWKEAVQHLEMAAGRATRVGDLQALRQAARVLAELAILEGHAAAAVARLMPLLDRPGLAEFDVTVFLPVLAWAYLELDDLAQAEQVIAQALRRARAEQLRVILVDALRVQALILLRQRQWDEAGIALEEGLSLARAMPYPYAEARLLHVYGCLLAERDKAEPSRERLEAALAIFRRLGACKDVEYTEHLLTTLS